MSSAKKACRNITFIKSGHARYKLYMVQNYDNGNLEGLAVANPLNSKPIVS